MKHPCKRVAGRAAGGLLGTGIVAIAINVDDGWEPLQGRLEVEARSLEATLPASTRATKVVEAREYLEVAERIQFAPRST